MFPFLNGGVLIIQKLGQEAWLTHAENLKGMFTFPDLYLACCRQYRVIKLAAALENKLKLFVRLIQVACK